MENEPKVIKKFEQFECPHCNQHVIIGTQSMMPSVVSVNKISDIEKAKNDVIERLGDVKFTVKEDKEQIIKWLNNENTLLDSSDIEPLLRQIAVDQLEKDKI